MTTYKKGFLAIIALIVLTGGALAYIEAPGSASNRTASAEDASVRVDADLVQDKVLLGGDGRLALGLTLTADALPETEKRSVNAVDLAVVLDRSGSMQGEKLSDAIQAIHVLLGRLTERDRLSLVTYSDRVEVVSPLLAMDKSQRRLVAARADRIFSGGGTNLGAGLAHGILTLQQKAGTGRQRKVILISDGLANQGVTRPDALGRMAVEAGRSGIRISTVGVGSDFNEILMTAIADQGAGRYHFLENPQAFARVFEHECKTARTVAAAGLEVRVSLKDGLRLVDAGGYPITIDGETAVIRPGDLLNGQSRKLFLSFEVPTDRERTFELGGITLHYHKAGGQRTIVYDHGLSVACVADRREVLASIEAPIWTDRVLQDDYGRLKEQVADAMRRGEKDRALEQIREYENLTRSINAAVGSAPVAQNLDSALPELRRQIEETFTGDAGHVAEKRKKQAKVLQYESYQNRRDRK